METCFEMGVALGDVAGELNERIDFFGGSLAEKFESDVEVFGRDEGEGSAGDAELFEDVGEGRGDGD